MKIPISTYLAFLAIVLTTFGCQKLEPPVQSDDEPDFEVKVIIGAQDTTFAGGIDDYYMFSDFEKTSNGLHVFTGEFRDINCEENCPNSLKIKIYDFELSPESDIDINESIALDTEYEYASTDMEDTTYLMTFTPDLPEEATGNYEYIWTIDSEIFEQETVDVIKENRFYGNVCLELVDANDMCNGNVCRNIEFDEAVEEECFAKLIIADTLPGLDSVRLTVITSDGLLPNNILWNTGEITDTIGVTMLDIFSFTGNSNTCPIAGEGQLNGNLTQPQNVFFCTPDFETEFDIEFTPLPEFVIGKIVIEYIDENGVFYSSINNESGGFMNFRVTSLASYDRNERNQATVILEVEFSSTVVSAEGIALEIVEGRGTIAVAFPD